MEILKWSVDYLTGKGIEDARSNVEWLLCEILSYSRMDLYLKFDRPMSEAELARYRPLLLRCAAHQPVQQLVGSCEFYGFKLAVNDKVLIPRPETERLVEACIREAAALTEAKTRAEITASAAETEQAKPHSDDGAEVFNFKPELYILDIGAGSGCISIALAKHIPNAVLYAMEKSADAIEVLQRNIHYHDLEKRVQILEQDILEFRPQRRFDIIVSNPPYIAVDEMAGLDPRVSHYEPYMALSDADDGLSFYHYFASRFPEWLMPDAPAFLEFGGKSQSAALKNIFSAFRTEIILDYQGNERVLVLRLKNGDEQ